MNRWKTILDRMVSGNVTDAPPPCVKNMELPSPDSWEPGRVTCSWEIDPRFFIDRNALFGGFIAALADHVLALATMTVIKGDEHFATSDLRTSFFRPVYGKMLTMEAVVVHHSRNMVNVEVSFIRDDGKLAAKSTATQVILRRKAK